MSGGPLIDQMEGGSPRHTSAGTGATEDGFRLNFVLIGDDAGPRTTDLMKAAPVGRWSGKSGQSPKGSQGRAKLGGVDGWLGRDSLVSSEVSRIAVCTGRWEGWLDPGKP